MKKYKLTHKQKQLIHVSYLYLDSYIGKCKMKDKQVDKIYDVLGKLSHVEADSWTKSVENAHKYLTKLTEGKDVECNGLILSLGLVDVFACTASIDTALRDKIYKSINKIYNDVEKHLGDSIEFKNANRVVRDFT